MSAEQAKGKEFFDNLYNKYHAIVFKYILVSLNFNEHQARDCAQEVFLTVYEKIDIILEHPNPGGFIIITAKNNIKKYRSKLLSQIERTISLECTPSKNLSYSVNFDELNSDELDVDALKDTFLLMLSSQELLLYKLFYEEKISIAKIANELGITISSVKVKLFRLRAKVRNIIRRELSDEERSCENK